MRCQPLREPLISVDSCSAWGTTYQDEHLWDRALSSHLRPSPPPSLGSGVAPGWLASRTTYEGPISSSPQLCHEALSPGRVSSCQEPAPWAACWMLVGKENPPTCKPACSPSLLCSRLERDEQSAFQVMSSSLAASQHPLAVTPPYPQGC